MWASGPRSRRWIPAADRDSDRHYGKVVPRSSQRRVLSDSAFDLQRPFRDLTTVEAEQQTSLYLGAWAKATGFVAEPVEVAPNRGQDLALARRPTTAPVVYVFFARDETKRESKPGRRISVEGKVTEVGPWRVVLTECHVLSDKFDRATRAPLPCPSASTVIRICPSAAAAGSSRSGALRLEA